MHTIEPYYRWREHYIASEDEYSPFYQREYSKFEFHNTIYNYFIHPQWDYIGSPTLYLKILYVNYAKQCAIIELIGEWNDCINNDIMYLKREVADCMLRAGIRKFILIGENVLNFHSLEDCYYEEWWQDISFDPGGEGLGWIAMLNFRDHIMREMESISLEQFVHYGTPFNKFDWRTMEPLHLVQRTESLIKEEDRIPSKVSY
jgi:hypothetical protein